MAQVEVPAVEAGPIREPVEQLHPLADDLDLLRVVELETKGAGRDRRRQCPQRGVALEDDDLEAGPGSEEGGGTADDSAADDDQVGRGRRFGREADRRRAHAASLTA